MDGSTLNAGGVACIRNVANPIKVARLVMEKVYFLIVIVYLAIFSRHKLLRIICKLSTV